MTPRDRGRRVPPKARGPRPASQPDPTSGETPAGTDAVSFGSLAAGDAAGDIGGDAGGAPVGARPPTRSQNRAAKRAATGVRPKVRGGRVTGRSSRSSNPAIIGLAIAAIAVVGAVFLIGNPLGGVTPSPSPTTRVFGDGTCPTSQPAALPAGESKLVTIKTSLGDIVIRVDGALSPIAAGNFVALAECKYYDGVVFHRTPTLQDGTPFVIQGGDPDGTGSGGPGYTIQDETVTATYKRGVVAMARSQAPNSQGSQFFIVLDDKSAAPLAEANTYAIFGNVVSGMEVADAIHEASAGVELPGTPIVMTSVTVTDAPPATAPPAASGGPTASPAASAAASAAASPGPTAAPTP